ncbi:amidase [Gordonia alkanivorans]|jgi:aspartyl-tRNA(Asn)/glutamyl-tRNA(Gln) amidotransferase subunit A|uniref:amidase n=1 Tax=Gordonia alkanivorans NBRC 16433 TaxID=1027371 RepID=F9W162_9ACTN|nr:amidase [Gordonia alkanivorans]AZZ83293.1 amidase [Gordonia alkanivorans]MDH3051750.1 amidase [Gordonia alkanivorans]GAA14601.1 putative amidase [Gordonia alkanivorans NBRC 16433]
MTLATDLTRMSASDLAAAIRSRSVTAVEVTEAALGRVNALDDHLHAFVERTDAAALDRAAAVDEAFDRGEDPGPLAGVPIAVKDLIATAGVVTRSGSIAYQDWVPDEDDIVVERVKAAGAIILGKTTVPEFGYSGVGHNPVSPAARNPWNPDLTPGGSSAGSAVAVATGMAPLSLGSDGGGSIRIPASLCGLVGFKASMGRVPLYPGCRDERFPGVSSWETLEHIGPITRTTADAALLMSVIAGPDARDRHSLPAGDVDWLDCVSEESVATAVEGKTIGYTADFGLFPVDPRVRDVVGRAVGVFADLGARVIELDPALDDPTPHFWPLVMADSDLAGMRQMVADHGGQMSPHLVELLTRPWSAEELTTAQMGRKRLVNQMWKLMQGIDLLVTPTLSVPAFPIGMQGPEVIDGQMVSAGSWMAFLGMFNMTGQPAVSVPAGVTDDGLPIGMQIVGPHLDDGTTLRAAAAFEAARPWAHRWPDPAPAAANEVTS